MVEVNFHIIFLLIIYTHVFDTIYYNTHCLYCNIYKIINFNFTFFISYKTKNYKKFKKN